VNDRGFYDPLLSLIDHSVEHRFVKPRMRALLHVHPDPEAVLDACEKEAGAGRAAAEYDPGLFLPMGDG